MKKVMISFAGKEDEAMQERLVESAITRFDECLLYEPEDLDKNFRKEHQQILACTKGYGYGIWKPYIILKTMEELKESDFCFYLDSNCVFTSDPAILFDLCTESDGILLFSNKVRLLSTWTKMDCFVQMGLTGRKYANAPLLKSAFQLYRKNKRSMQFVREYMDYCSDYQLISDAPNLLGENCPGFREHRHDKSILSLLAAKHSLPIYRDPSQWGNHLQDRFGQIIVQRREN